MAGYDEGLVPLFTSVQFGRNGYPGESNPWAQWQYQSAFATQIHGTGQHGKQYSPGGAVGPALSARQPGTWPPNIPPGVLGTMQTTQAEASYMLEPGVVPRLSQMFGLQVPPLLPPPSQPPREQNMFHSRSVRRGATLRSGRYPSISQVAMPGAEGGDKLPPPICKQGQQLLQTSPGVYKCVDPYTTICPTGYMYKGKANGMAVCGPKPQIPTPPPHRNPSGGPECIDHAHGTDCYNKRCAWSESQEKYVCRWIRVPSPTAPGVAGPGALAAAPTRPSRAMICQVRPGGKCCTPEGPGGLFKCIRDLWGRKKNPVVTRTHRQWAANPSLGTGVTQGRYQNPAHGAVPGRLIGTASHSKPCPPGQVRCPQGQCADSVADCGFTTPPRPGGPQPAVSGCAAHCANAYPYPHDFPEYQKCLTDCQGCGDAGTYTQQYQCLLDIAAKHPVQPGVRPAVTSLRRRRKRRGRASRRVSVGKRKRLLNNVGTLALASMVGHAVRNAVS